MQDKGDRQFMKIKTKQISIRLTTFFGGHSCSIVTLFTGEHRRRYATTTGYKCSKGVLSYTGPEIYINNVLLNNRRNILFYKKTYVEVVPIKRNIWHGEKYLFVLIGSTATPNQDNGLYDRLCQHSCPYFLQI